MTHALIRRGYRNIAFLGEADDAWTRGAARRRGFAQAMQSAGLSAHRILQLGKPPLLIEDGAMATPELLSRYPDVDCIFCVSDVPAFGVLSALTGLNKSVPQDIGVAGFGNFEVSWFSNPSITTVVVDPLRIGRATGSLLSELFSETDIGNADSRMVAVEVELSFRGSTKPL